MIAVDSSGIIIEIDKHPPPHARTPRTQKPHSLYINI